MQPRFSPDGKEIVFVSDRSGDDNLWLVASGDGGPRARTTGQDVTYLSPEWTPDGNYVVVAKSTLTGLEKIWLYHVKGGRGLEMAGGPPGLRVMGPAGGAKQGPALRVGVPAGALPRRQVAGLRLAPRRGDWPGAPRAGDRGGALARLSHPAGRAGIYRQHGCAAGLCVHAGLPSHRDLVRR